MRLLFLGDIVGRMGREVVARALPELRSRLKVDFAIVNGENSAAGFGITEKIAEELFAAGADCITLGDHAFDQPSIAPYLDREPRLLRPINIADQPVAGRGSNIYRLADGRQILVIQALGQSFMKRAYANPFLQLDQLLQMHPLGTSVHSIILDFHAETTSEKMAMGHFCDARLSAVIGTHTHVPTADARILTGGTAYQSDAGMCGDYDSVIGMEKNLPLQRFVGGIPTLARFKPASNQATAFGVLIETDSKTGLARNIASIRWPDAGWPGGNWPGNG